MRRQQAAKVRAQQAKMTQMRKKGKAQRDGMEDDAWMELPTVEQ